MFVDNSIVEYEKKQLVRRQCTLVYTEQYDENDTNVNDSVN
jgi:hypothetical protein